MKYFTHFSVVDLEARTRVWILTEDQRDSIGEKERANAEEGGDFGGGLFDAAEEFQR